MASSSCAGPPGLASQIVLLAMSLCRALAKVRAASDMRIAELEVRERQLEERGQQRMRELGKSVAEKAREAEAQLEKAGERRKNFWADKTERTEKAHQGEERLGVERTELLPFSTFVSQLRCLKILCRPRHASREDSEGDGGRGAGEGTRHRARCLQQGVRHAAKDGVQKG